MSQQIVAQPSVMKPRFRVENYGYRSFAVFELDQLVVVTLYKRGAIAVAERLESLVGGGFEVKKTERISNYINPFR